MESWFVWMTDIQYVFAYFILEDQITLKECSEVQARRALRVIIKPKPETIDNRKKTMLR